MRGCRIRSNAPQAANTAKHIKPGPVVPGVFKYYNLKTTGSRPRRYKSLFKTMPKAKNTKIDLSAAKKLIKKYSAKKGVLIPLLQDVQAAYGYVPGDVVSLIAKELGIYPVDIYGILTFYAQFYLTPQGKHIIKVCDGTSCHLKGGEKLLTRLVGDLKITREGTAEDLQFSLEKVRCQGCCQLGPVMKIDDAVHGPVTQEKALKLIKEQK